MKQGLSVIASADHIYVKFSGAFDVGLSRDAIDETIAQCLRHGVAKLLFDCRGLSGEIGTLDRYDLATYSQCARDAGIRTALLVSPEHFIENRFFESVAVNRSVDLRVFTDAREAAEWLEVERFTETS